MGGNVFDGTTPVKYEYLEDFYREIFRHVPLRSGLLVVGSALNKKPEYNDLDFVFEADNMEWNVFVTHLKNTFEEVKKITNQCYSCNIFSPYDDEWHQVDFMQSRNLDFSVRVYHSSKESRYKSAHRNILLMSMIKVMTQKEFNLGNDRLVRTRQHLDLFEGLVYLVQKKNKDTVRYTTIDRVPLSLDFVESIRKFLPNITDAKLDSFETVHEEIFRYFYREQGARKVWLDILKETIETLTSAKLEIPMEIKFWNEVPEFV